MLGARDTGLSKTNTVLALRSLQTLTRQFPRPALLYCQGLRCCGFLHKAFRGPFLPQSCRPVFWESATGQCPGTRSWLILPFGRWQWVSAVSSGSWSGPSVRVAPMNRLRGPLKRKPFCSAPRKVCSKKGACFSVEVDGLAKARTLEWGWCGFQSQNCHY